MPDFCWTCRRERRFDDFRLFGGLSDDRQVKRTQFLRTAQSAQVEVIGVVTDTEISKPRRIPKYESAPWF